MSLISVMLHMEGTNIKCSAYEMKRLSKCEVWKYIQGMYLLQYLKIKYLALQEDWESVLVIEWALSFKSLVKRTWIGTISISIVYVLTYDQPLCTISFGSVPWFSDKLRFWSFKLHVWSTINLPLNLSEVCALSV